MYQHLSSILFILLICNIACDEINNETLTNETTEQTENIDLVWLSEALKDVVYYLRAHKFNEFDRRYNTRPGEYFARNPKPPLRSLHWEVKKHCEDAFYDCIKYLDKIVKHTVLRRKDDTSTIVHQQKWYGSNYSEQINTVENECKQLRERDNIHAKPFQGPLERFQWRTTAIYYMCWYVMNEVQYLQSIGERCDNFATCSDSKFGINNKDPRASDDSSFRCVMYSVCPDPCCPIRHIANFDECWNSQVNPCYQNNPIGHRQCRLERNGNTDFTDLVLNRWNVTCECSEPGYIWESRYGTCVDVNECATAMHNCDDKSEICVNQAGGYRCVCNWGYVWNMEHSRCEPSAVLDIIKRHRQQQAIVHSNEPFSVKLLIKKLFYKSVVQRLDNSSSVSSPAPSVRYGPGGGGGAWIVTFDVAVIIGCYFLNITC